MKRLPLDSIVFDAGTQVRASLDQQVVADYAHAMTEGSEFPPIVVFHDGTRYYLADGFHRFMAAQRLSVGDIAAEVRPGTQHEAVWFALGANRTNGRRLTEADKSHAVVVALQTWPERLHTEIAAQIGCTPSLVSKVSSKFTRQSGGPVLTGRALRDHLKRAAVQALVKQNGGLKRDEIAARAKVSVAFVSKVCAEMGVTRYDRTREGVTRRRTRMREMAGEGYTSRQIADAVGMSVEGCRDTLQKEGIAVPADRVVGKTKRHNAARIIEQIVADAENLTEAADLIDFADVDGAGLGDWIDSLVASKRKLEAFIKRLVKEKEKHGEAA